MTIETVAALEALYGKPKPPSLRKVAQTLTPGYRTWIERARFCVLTTVGPEGSDASPRGDDGPVVREIDATTLAMPDWRGNDRLDSLRNIVRDPRVSLMFMVPGSTNVIRLNGKGRVTADPDVLASFDRGGKRPRSVILITIGEIYFQCARAVMRAGLWTRDDSEGLPSAGDLLAEMTQGDIGGAPYDAEWPERAKKTMW
ncbi:MAG: pyridoxamine 5'-phosphate oxidase family protein [Pseudomonadota bacterium]